MSRTYRTEIGDFFEILKNMYSQKRAEDPDFLFAVQQNVVQAAAQNVLKTTIGVSEKAAAGMKMELSMSRRKKTVKKYLGDDDDDDGDNTTSFVGGGPEESKMNPDEALNHALLKLTTIMVREQNFIMEFFGISKSLPIVVTSSDMNSDQSDDSVETWQNSLSIPRQAFKDAKAEKRIK